MFDSRKRKYVNLISATVLIASQGSLAQERQLEEVVVSGSSIKQSEMASIDAKREAINVVDAVSADTIGRFPGNC